MNVTTIGLDVAKNVFQAHGVDRHGKTVLQKRLPRAKVLTFFANVPKCLIGMEACGSAHHWARELEKFGHQVRLMAPQFVKPYVKSQKNDRNDAAAISEAVGRANMRFVAAKTVAQQDIQALHRIRSGLIAARTAKANQIRGLLAEYGIVVSKRLNALRRALPGILEDAENGLTGTFRTWLAGLYQDLAGLDTRVTELDRAVAECARAHPACGRLATIPGIGPVTATALLAAVGGGEAFRNGRQFAAWVGLVPRQHSSGGQDRLLGLSRRGNKYLRTLLIHGARAVLRTARNKDDTRSRWLQEVATRRHPNIAAVALANKNARIAWAVLRNETTYRST